MKLFNRQSREDVNTSEYYANPGSEGSTSIDWKRAAPRLAAVLVFLIILVFGILSLTGAFDKSEPAAKKTNTPARPQTAEKPTEQKKTAPSSSTPPRKGSSSTSAPATTPAQTSQNPSNTGKPTSSTQLANTGPGEVTGLFVITSAAGVLTYQVALRRRLGSS